MMNKVIEKMKCENCLVIFDVDGVLNDFDYENHNKNFSYLKKRPLTSIIKKLKYVCRKNKNVFILSVSKDKELKIEKIEWLKKYVPFVSDKNILIIDKSKKESYPDSALKLMTLQDLYLPGYEKIYVVDDTFEVLETMKLMLDNVEAFHISSLID